MFSLAMTTFCQQLIGARLKKDSMTQLSKRGYSVIPIWKDIVFVHINFFKICF